MDATSNGAQLRVGDVGPVVDRHLAAEVSAAPTPKFGALDLGTNNCRLLIAEPAGDGLRVIDAFSRIVRLGEGLGVSGVLAQSAITRTMEALRVCANKLKWHGVAHYRLVATEACRMAANGADFVERITRELGLRIEIIDRETEAGFAAAGAAPLIDPEAETAVVFDIGGGSTEVMLMLRAGEGFELHRWASLPVGVVTLSEGQGGGRHVTPAIYENMRNQVRQMIAPFAASIAETHGADFAPSHLLGTSGTVTTVAGIHLGLRRYDRNRVDGCWLNTIDADAVTQRLVGMSYEERVRNGCIGHERADLVLAGCAIFDEIRTAFPSDRLRVADRGLREGILASLHAQHLNGIAA